jgi:hypothetical protein
MKSPFPFIAVLFFLFVLSGSMFAQDGSNMRYLKPSELTASDIGKWVHLDFGKRSFPIVATKFPPDSVDIEISGKPGRSKEHWVGDEFNKWYECQYLETVENERPILRITRNKLLSFDKETIRIEAFIHYLTPSGNKVQGKSFTQVLAFRKDILAEVLVRVGDTFEDDGCPL